VIVVEQIHAHATLTPAKVAVVVDNRPITYAAFNNQIAATRRYLERYNLRAGSVGVVWAHSIYHSWLLNLALRSLGLMTISVQSYGEISHFGRLDVGCVVTTEADAASPLSRLGLGETAASIRAPLSIFDEDESAPLAPPPIDRLDGGHIVLTSATTGVYKKIWLNPAKLEEGVQTGMQRIRDNAPSVTGGEDRVVNMASFGLWTGSGYGTPVAMWMMGSTVVIYQAADLWRSFDYPGITHAMLTPAFLQQILSAPEGALQPQPGAQVVVVGGAMSVSLARRARSRLTQRLASMLGSTEGGMWAVTPILSDEDLRLHRVQPGRTLEIVDEDHNPVAAGELGQLRVRIDDGPAGYYDDEAATQTFFRDGWFYPGDLAVLRPDGRLSLHGRVTDVISIMGDKYPAEPFERGLQERLEVEDVCVFSMPGSEREELHVVLQSSAPVPEAAVAEAVKAVLDGFPRAHVHVVDMMPRNHMGKVQRLKLKQALMAASAPELGLEQARTAESH
jgi:acyl-coenzyme A synthetase/AMP-(fatty) acid ligase